MLAGLPLMKNLLISLVKIVLLPLGLKLPASATDATIGKKIYGSVMTALILSNKKMDGMTKIVKSFGESGLLTKIVG